MFWKIYMIVLLTYFLVGIIRTSLSWKGHRAHIQEMIVLNPRMAKIVSPPWLRWVLHASAWPCWLSDYKAWRANTRIINAKISNRARRGNASS